MLVGFSSNKYQEANDDNMTPINHSGVYLARGLIYRVLKTDGVLSDYRNSILPK